MCVFLYDISTSKHIVHTHLQSAPPTSDLTTLIFYTSYSNQNTYVHHRHHDESNSTVENFSRNPKQEEERKRDRHMHPHMYYSVKKKSILVINLDTYVFRFVIRISFSTRRSAFLPLILLACISSPLPVLINLICAVLHDVTTFFFLPLLCFARMDTCMHACTHARAYVRVHTSSPSPSLLFSRMSALECMQCNHAAASARRRRAS